MNGVVKILQFIISIILNSLFSQEVSVNLRKGEEKKLSNYLLKFENISKTEIDNFTSLKAEIHVTQNDNKSYITSFLFKLKSKPAALYSALSGFAINGVNMTKLQSFPEKNSFSSFFFLCDIEGHIDDQKIKNSLEELGLHCEDMHVLGVFKSDKFRLK